MIKIKNIINTLESWAPKNLQESYDNSGLICGNKELEVTKVLISLDTIENVVDEAIYKECNLIISHHPIVFKGLKKLTGSNYIERTIIKAIKNDIAIYAIHTNLDNIHTGVNAKISEKIGLEKTRVLQPKTGTLLKLSTFVPKENCNALKEALNEAGAGNIGKYENCSFVSEGQGFFKPTAAAEPFIGNTGELESLEEMKIEVIFPTYQKNKILSALHKNHPYEEVAYYLHALENSNPQIGSGMIGELPQAMSPGEFLLFLKEKMELKQIRYTKTNSEKIKTVALCGGAGSFLLHQAKIQKADAFITGDFKYHEFFDAENELMIADIGHYESEVYTKELIYEYLSEKFSNIVVYLSEINTNPVHYI